MAPSEGEAPAAESAFSFLSKSLTEVQKKVIQSKMESPLNLSVEDFDLLKGLKPKLGRSWSDVRAQQTPKQSELWLVGLGEQQQQQQQRERGVVVSRKKLRVSEKWEEPLRKVKRTVEESLCDLETTAAASKSPVEFLENVQKTEFFANVKRNLKLAKGDKHGTDVAPLSAAELLESLVRQSEPLLDHLGIKREVTEKLREMVRSSKRKQLQLSNKPGVSKESLIDDELDLRIASVIQSTGYKHQTVKEDMHRNIAIVTTASLPWMTGTAVNPLFRAAYLARSGEQNVTLLVPWLCKNDQVQVYPNQTTFESPAEQENFVRKWVEDRVGFKCDFKIAFYPGKFSTEKRSILAAGDISQFIPDQEADVAVLEEPEHLTWYYHGRRWTDKFQHVVGVVHTNYLEYVQREKNGKLQAFFLRHVNNWVIRCYCNKVLRLSAATQNCPRSSVCNVHGVNPQFLSIGRRIAETDSNEPKFFKGAYYLGKMIWGKGYRELVDLLAQNKEVLGNINLDLFGSGEDSDAVKAEAQKYGLALNFHPGRDHADASLHGYKVFINPSTSDVVCTTTAEALAMGKIVVCADHPSNEFFRPFPNCYTYRTPEEFVEKVHLALSSEPQPLAPELQHLLMGGRHGSLHQVRGAQHPASSHEGGEAKAAPSAATTDDDVVVGDIPEEDALKYARHGPLVCASLPLRNRDCQKSSRRFTRNQGHR